MPRRDALWTGRIGGRRREGAAVTRLTSGREMMHSAPALPKQRRLRARPTCGCIAPLIGAGVTMRRRDLSLCWTLRPRRRAYSSSVGNCNDPYIGVSACTRDYGLRDANVAPTVALANHATLFYNRARQNGLPVDVSHRFRPDGRGARGLSSSDRSSAEISVIRPPYGAAPQRVRRRRGTTGGIRGKNQGDGREEVARGISAVHFSGWTKSVILPGTCRDKRPRGLAERTEYGEDPDDAESTSRRVRRGAIANSTSPSRSLNEARVCPASSCQPLSSDVRAKRPADLDGDGFRD